MPRNLTEIVAKLQHAISTSNPDELSREELQTTIALAHSLLVFADLQTAKGSPDELKNYISLSNLLLEQLILSLKSPDFVPTKQAFSSAQIINTLLQTYTDHVVPMLNRLSNITKDQNILTHISELTILGSELLDCSSQVVRYTDKLNPIEKIYAYLGVVLLQTGVGILIALTIKQDNVDIPPLTALPIIPVASFLCSKSVAKHKNAPESSPINTSIERQRKLLNELAQRLDGVVYNPAHQPTSPAAKTPKAPAKPKKAKAPAATEPEAMPNEEIETVEVEITEEILVEQPGVLDIMKSSFAKLFGKTEEKPK